LIIYFPGEKNDKKPSRLGGTAVLLVGQLKILQPNSKTEVIKSDIVRLVKNVTSKGTAVKPL
jgi:hypothetical protein